MNMNKAHSNYLTCITPQPIVVITSSGWPQAQTLPCSTLIFFPWNFLFSLLHHTSILLLPLFSSFFPLSASLFLLPLSLVQVQHQHTSFWSEFFPFLCFLFVFSSSPFSLAFIPLDFLSLFGSHCLFFIQLLPFPCTFQHLHTCWPWLTPIWWYWNSLCLLLSTFKSVNMLFMKCLKSLLCFKHNCLFFSEQSLLLIFSEILMTLFKDLLWLKWINSNMVPGPLDVP